MDEIVKAALQKWPNVPHCYDWLALDARGDWFMRDERIQLAGPFPQVKGSRITHDKLQAFIARNYEPDEDGCWYFQNGPQRVYVTLEVTPWVMGVRQVSEHAFEIETHTGRAVQQVRRALIDESGRLYLETDLGLGIVRSPDMLIAAQALEVLAWPVSECLAADLPTSHGFTLKPTALPNKSRP